MVIMYLIISLMPCIGYISIFTNFKTSITRLQCKFAWIFIYCSAVIAYTIVNLTFLHRVYVIFKDSAYEYKPCVYKSLFTIIILAPVMILSPIFVGVFKYQQSLSTEYDPSTDITLCSSSFSGQSGTPIFVGISTIIGQILPSIALLFLFIHGLWSMNKQLMKHFLEEHNTNSNQEELQPVPTQSNHEVVSSASNVLDEWTKQKTIAREQLRPEVQRIMKLHNLIKKQTILACISIISTCILGITPVIDLMAGMGLGWDIIINGICLWMMLDTSTIYWNVCKKHGVCSCCYWKTNKLGL